MGEDYVIKRLAPLRLAALTATVEPATVGTHVEPMFVQVGAAMPSESGALDTPVATYDDTGDGLALVVGYAWPGPVPAGLEAVDLPAAEAVCGVHLGPMNGIQASWQRLRRWVAEHGWRTAGPARELYVRARSADQSDWVTELQQPVTRGTSRAGHMGGL